MPKRKREKNNKNKDPALANQESRQARRIRQRIEQRQDRNKRYSVRNPDYLNSMFKDLDQERRESRQRKPGMFENGSVNGMNRISLGRCKFWQQTNKAFARDMAQCGSDSDSSDSVTATAAGGLSAADSDQVQVVVATPSQ